MTTFYIVRHGETIWNVQGLVQGHKDSPLTENGIQQAQKLAEELRHIQFDYVFSSDLLRAKRTAEIISLEKELAVQTTEALRENSYGKYDGMKKEEFKKLFVEKWKTMTDEERVKFKLSDDMESNEEVVGRFITFLRELSVAFPNKTILIVSHSGVMRYFYIHLGYATYSTFTGFENLGYMKVESDGVDFFLKEVQGVRKP